MDDAVDVAVKVKYGSVRSDVERLVRLGFYGSAKDFHRQVPHHAYKSVYVCLNRLAASKLVASTWEKGEKIFGSPPDAPVSLVIDLVTMKARWA